MCFFFLGELQAQELPDTTKIHSLQEINVTSSYIGTSKMTSPLQILQTEDIQRLNVLQVSDAVKYFSGVMVNDYGGVGGLKTVSIRSLGANYTTVAYDGITLSDYQSGQIDLGKFSLDNVEMISLNIGESDDIFQTARIQASAGALNIITHSFQPTLDKKNEIKAGLKTGSFGLINPSVLYSQAINQTFSAQFSAEYLKTKGDYPYTQYYGYDKDTSSVEKRNNSDVETWKLEANLFGRLKRGGKLSFKAYYYDSDRGIPGPSIYYNNTSGERTDEQNFFIQSHFEQSLTSKIDFQANAKFNYSHTDYVDTKNGRQENIYYQREYYLNATILYKLLPALSFSWANDIASANFENNFDDCVYPSRITWQSVFAGKYEKKRFTVTGSLLATSVNEATEKGETPEDAFKLSPYLGFSIQPFSSVLLRIRSFYKNTFRMPTFSDLYFSRVPTKNLQPENAHQYNLGLSWSGKINALLPFFTISSDFYLNKIENKIVAFPKYSMFIWSVQNYGKVEIKGVDLNASVHLQTGEKFQWQLEGAYTYQHVLDKTDASKASYNQQLKYAPHHIGSGRLTTITPWFDFNYTITFCGDRYFETLNEPEYMMDAYSSQGISIIRNFNWKKAKVLLSAECLNIFDQQYEVIRSYPMPGREFRFGVKVFM